MKTFIEICRTLKYFDSLNHDMVKTHLRMKDWLKAKHPQR